MNHINNGFTFALCKAVDFVGVPVVARDFRETWEKGSDKCPKCQMILDLQAARESLRDCERRALTLWERWTDVNDKSASVQSNEFTRQVESVVNDARLARAKIQELEGER